MDEFKEISFEADPDTFRDLNNIFKNAFTAPDKTSKTINLDSNQITLDTRRVKLFGLGKDQAEVRVSITGQGVTGVFYIGLKEVDTLFPTNLQ
jgi:hypothetical protein